MSTAKRIQERAMSPACGEVRRWLSEYLDGHVSEEDCEAIRSHVVQCTDCAALANTLDRTVDLCRRLPPDEIPPDVRRRLKDALRSRLPR